jgi:hypothetical protein
MAKYMILYRAPMSAREQMENSTPEQRQAGMEAWMTWAGKAASAILDLGSPASPAGHVGAGAAGSQDVGGYSLLQADSMAAVEAILDGHPHLQMPGASIDVLELMPPPGM